MERGLGGEVGAAPIAGPAVPDDVALATVREAWDQGVRPEGLPRSG